MIKRKAAFKTLGCRLNQYETDAIAHEFRQNGFELVGFGDDADVYVVNTCTVTNQSDHKSRNEIEKAGRKNSLLVVTGCMATSAREKLGLNSSITYLVENDRKKSIFSLVDAHFRGEIVRPEDLEKDVFGFPPVTDKVFHTRSSVKIQDGCDNFCTFCIVPFVRGRAVSRPVKDILENVRLLVEQGSKEMVITGVNIGRYRHENTDFEGLIEKILDVPGRFRLRISSIEPEGFGDRLFGLYAHPMLTPHLHLCLQSGSDSILKKMKRSYTVKGYMGMVEKLRNRYPDFCLTTDILVGFPGETEEDFNQTCHIAGEAAFSHIHTFKYSVREGTRAARMEGQVTEKEKSRRSGIIRAVSDENKLRYRQGFLGKIQDVLVEKVRGKTGQGYSEHFIPVQVKMPGIQNNDLVRVRITGIREGDEPLLVGDPA